MSYPGGRFNTEVFAGVAGAAVSDLMSLLAHEDVELVFDVRGEQPDEAGEPSFDRLAHECEDAAMYYLRRPELGRQAEEDLFEWAAGIAQRHRACVLASRRSPEVARQVAEAIAARAHLRVIAFDPPGDLPAC